MGNRARRVTNTYNDMKIHIGKAKN
ncbi:uncharacterized protein G2W53_017732 [Senna tora]|uniref:Uncharacterized protein n=1 Tax=Senna tora TaxID=362788 RepID=A0A834TQG3_9FABA|nr:uncharacterized protein G2W53_017732 [Senna tora]